MNNGWGGRTRTYNLRSQSPSLCQLSYAPEEIRHKNHLRPPRKKLTLRVLRAFAGFVQADLFSLYFAGVAGDEAGAA